MDRIARDLRNVPAVRKGFLPVKQYARIPIAEFAFVKETKLEEYLC